MSFKFNKIFILNIIICLALIYIMVLLQQYFVLSGHDYYWIYFEEKTSFFKQAALYDRKLATILTNTILNVIPKILDIHKQDYISGLCAVIKSILYLFVCFSAATGFYIKSKNNTKNISGRDISVDY